MKVKDLHFIIISRLTLWLTLVPRMIKHNYFNSRFDSFGIGCKGTKNNRHEQTLLFWYQFSKFLPSRTNLSWMLPKVDILYVEKVLQLCIKEKEHSCSYFLAYHSRSKHIFIYMDESRRT